MVVGLLLFLLIYGLIAAPRLRLLPLDRPTGALVGASAFVILGFATPAQAIAAINGDTLLLLFGLMGVGAVLAEQGLLEAGSDWALRRLRKPQLLLAALIWGGGGLAAFITNDAVCVLVTPLVVVWIERRRLPAFPFLLALATAANTGSVATLVGNPQNMLCATLGALNYRTYVLHMAPVAMVGLAMNHLAIAWAFRSALRNCDSLPAQDLAFQLRSSESGSARWVTLIITCGSVIAYLCGAHLATTAVISFALLLAVQRNEGHSFWSRIDWTVLVFFAALFVIVDGFVRSGGAGLLLRLLPLSRDTDLLGVLNNAAVFLIGSNVVSNVPFILVIRPYVEQLPHPQFWWQLLAMASTFAGNMTLLGSVANIIVAEGGAKVGGLPFGRYLKIGLPLSLLTTLLGALWLYAISDL